MGRFLFIIYNFTLVYHSSRGQWTEPYLHLDHFAISYTEGLISWVRFVSHQLLCGLEWTLALLILESLYFFWFSFISKSYFRQNLSTFFCVTDPLHSIVRLSNCQVWFKGLCARWANMSVFIIHSLIYLILSAFFNIWNGILKNILQGHIWKIQVKNQQLINLLTPAIYRNYPD